MFFVLTGRKNRSIFVEFSTTLRRQTTGELDGIADCRQAIKHVVVRACGVCQHFIVLAGPRRLSMETLIFLFFAQIRRADASDARRENATSKHGPRPLKFKAKTLNLSKKNSTFLSYLKKS